MDQWVGTKSQVALDHVLKVIARQFRFIGPCKPDENAFAESFDGKCREECLNEHLS